MLSPLATVTPAIAHTPTIEWPPRTQAVVRSALWAAWGDALGFPAELADESLLQRRLDGPPDGRLRPWTRRVGGRMGPFVELPAGCTSDDTQLRLAVGRCIRATGRFDAEAFSKIELPVFLTYQLGAGRGTKAAAQSLGRRGTRWFSNFFDAKGSIYVNGGGNGAAMRIQPHVWAASNGRPEAYLAPALRDAICTHGHPRGILGAALHAVALGMALRQGAIPGPDRWSGMVRFLARVERLVSDDAALTERWLPVWENNAGRSWPDVVREVLQELEGQMAAAAEAARVAASQDSAQTYARLVRDLGGLNPKTRGAGTTTAVLALWIAHVYQADPYSGTRLAAGLLGSDTDTVATMAGALLGAVVSDDPPEQVMDQELIIAEAWRLAKLADGQVVESFPHPDPMRWQPTKGLSDAYGLIDGRPAVAGLGLAEEVGGPLEGQGKDPGIWQWVTTDYGQRLLIKRRPQLAELPDGARPRRRPAVSREPVYDSTQPHLFASDSADDDLPADPEGAVQLLALRDFDDALMARLLRHFASTSALAAATFAALVSDRLRVASGAGIDDNGGSPAEPPRPARRGG